MFAGLKGRPGCRQLEPGQQRIQIREIDSETSPCGVGVRLTPDRVEDSADVSPSVRRPRLVRDSGQHKKVSALALEPSGDNSLEIRAEELAWNIEDEIDPQTFVDECLSLPDNSALECCERFIHIAVRWVQTAYIEADRE